MIRVGTAGMDDSFKLAGYKSNIKVPEYLSKMGLCAYEYQCGRGVRLSAETKENFAKNAKEYDIAVSLHAPYYISMSSVDAIKRVNSVNYIMESAKAVKILGGKRVIFHTGSCAKISRETALLYAKETLELALNTLNENEISDIILCPETMGKINQLGTLDEVIEMCKLSEIVYPCVDFGHINAREQGSLKAIEDFDKILMTIKNELGSEKLCHMHMHFSKIEYTVGGEKKHLTFEDTVFGPNFPLLGELILKHNIEPTIICESDNTQVKDAQFMAEYLRK
ncbi:MAG: TIM barrel protein [Clostridia bacterium]